MDYLVKMDSMVTKEKGCRSLNAIDEGEETPNNIFEDQDSAEDVTLSNVFEEKADNFVMAALFCASEDGNLSGLQELLTMANNIDVNVANRHGESAVHMAASGGHVEVIKFLQSKGTDIGIADKNGDTAVYWAARQGHVDVIKYLQDEGVLLDSQNKSGEAAIHVAARYGHTNVVQYLCSSGSDVNIEDNLGETALHNAAWHGFARITSALCSAEPKLDVLNKEGETALHCAAGRGNLDCVKVLIEHGASMNITDKRGCTPLHMACNRHQTSIALCLLGANCEMDCIEKETGESALHVASREGLLSIVQTMCAYGCNVDTASQAGATPLHLASKGGHTEIVRCLLLSGAHSDVKNKDGVTAEIMALAQGFIEIAELLNKVRGERGTVFINQLLPSNMLPRLKLKILGSAGVGKTTLVESMKCGFFSSFFRRSRLTSTKSVNSKGKPQLIRQYSLPTPLCYMIENIQYTKGIDVQQINISGIGDLSVWDFSGYQPYYMLYDHFLGDINCVHAVVFSLTDHLEEQIAQVNFWLNFIRARIPPHLPIGHSGILPNIPKVILIATHADKANCVRNAKGEYISPEGATVLLKARHQFAFEMDIIDKVFILDAQVANTAEMKMLKQQILDIKTNIIKNLPKSNGFLEAMVMQLPSWRRSSSSFPVLSWQHFVEYVRAKVNPLAGDDHLKLLVQQLQLLGEIVYLESGSVQDMVVLHSKWLCNDIIGNLVSQEKMARTRITGCFSLDDFQLMYPETDALELLQVFESLEICTQCENDGDVEYEFPCLNFVETLNGLWQRDLKRYPDAVYGGVRIKTPNDCVGQLKHLFQRIQVQLRRTVLQDTDENDSDLYQWHHGTKYCCGNLEGLLNMDRHEQFLEIKVRGPEDSRTAVFYFLEDFINVVEQVIMSICPGMSIQRHILSCVHLKEHCKTIKSYSPHDILLQQLDREMTLPLEQDITEHFADLVCMGSDDIVHNITLGVDLHISHLTLHTRRLLSSLLDLPHPMGHDWCLLAVTLGMTSVLPSLDCGTNNSESNTDRTLEEWAKDPRSTIGLLISKLRELGRVDAVEVVLWTAPFFRMLIYEEPSTDESTAPAPIVSSTHTLSNLSR